MKRQYIQPLISVEIDEVAGGTDIPPPDGWMDLIPGWPWPPLYDPTDNPPPAG